MPAEPAAPPLLDLQELARARFPDLSDAELKLLSAAPKGERAVCSPNANDDDAANDPGNGDTWGRERAIRAELICWLAVDREAAERVDPKGLQIYGAKITGELDLSFAVVPFPLGLKRCRLMANVSLTDAQVPFLALPGCWALSVDADGINVQGGVFLQEGFQAHGEVRLLGAQIGGDLDCVGGSFENPPQQGIDGSGDALSADRLSVKGSVFLRQGFHAQGEVRLVGAQIGGNLDCHDARFENPPREGVHDSGRALNADGINVRGGVFLRQGFHALGAVRLLCAQIGSNLECIGGRFENPLQKGVEDSGKALNADGINVKGGIFLRQGFHAQGEVRLVGAQIGGNLDCKGGRFENPPQQGVEDSGRALNADRINVNGRVFLSDQFHAQGEVLLLAAQIGVDLDCTGGSFIELTAETATITGNFFWSAVGHPKGAAVVLDLRNASAGSIADDKESWPAHGNLFLDGFVYKRISEGPGDAKTRLEWLGLQRPFTPQPYRQLAKVLGEEGDPRGARKVLYEMEKTLRQEDAKRLNGWRGWWERFKSLWLKAVIGHGYYPLRAFAWLLAFVVLGFGIFWAGNSRGGIVPTDKAAYDLFRNKHVLPPYYERFNPLVYSLENSFPLVKLGQTDRWQPDPQPRWRVLRYFRWLQICAGWILATMFVAGVTGVVRRD